MPFDLLFAFKNYLLEHKIKSHETPYVDAPVHLSEINVKK